LDCYFHFCQAVYRKVGELGLKIRCQIEERKIKIKMLLAVAFLPVPQIDTGFSVLEAGTTEPITTWKVGIIGSTKKRVKAMLPLMPSAFSLSASFLIIHVIIFYTMLLDMPKHSLAKVEEATLHLGVGKVALNSRDQGCFEIAKKRRGIKLEASFFT
ncbi:hypothetical protein T08_6151, partial [Trichinella sp. T8]